MVVPETNYIFEDYIFYQYTIYDTLKSNIKSQLKILVAECDQTLDNIIKHIKRNDDEGDDRLSLDNLKDNIIEINILQNNLLVYQHDDNNLDTNHEKNNEQGGLNLDSLFDEDDKELVEDITKSYFMKENKKIKLLKPNQAEENNKLYFNFFSNQLSCEKNNIFENVQKLLEGLEVPEATSSPQVQTEATSQKPTKFGFSDIILLVQQMYEFKTVEGDLELGGGGSKKIYLDANKQLGGSSTGEILIKKNTTYNLLELLIKSKEELYISSFCLDLFYQDIIESNYYTFLSDIMRIKYSSQNIKIKNILFLLFYRSLSIDSAEGNAKTYEKSNRVRDYSYNEDLFSSIQSYDSQKLLDELVKSFISFLRNTKSENIHNYFEPIDNDDIDKIYTQENGDLDYDNFLDLLFFTEGLTKSFYDMDGKKGDNTGLKKTN